MAYDPEATPSGAPLDDVVLRMGSRVRATDPAGDFSSLWTNDGNEHGGDYVPAIANLDPESDGTVSSLVMAAAIRAASGLNEPGEEDDNPEYLRGCAEMIVRLREELGIATMTREAVIRKIKGYST